MITKSYGSEFFLIVSGAYPSDPLVATEAQSGFDQRDILAELVLATGQPHLLAVVFDAYRLYSKTIRDGGVGVSTIVHFVDFPPKFFCLFHHAFHAGMIP